MRIATIFFLLLSVSIAGCVTQVCPENLNLTSNNIIPYGEYPSLRSMNKVYDRSISVEGEIHALTIYTTGEQYYVRYYPLQSGIRTVYGPYNGNPEETMRCEE